MHVASTTHWLREGYSVLPKLLDLAGVDDDTRIQILLEGISSSGLSLGSPTLFGTAEIIARSLAPSDATELLDWYAKRLRERLPKDDRPLIPSVSVPSSLPEAVGRLVFSLMSDIDTRTRWKAAHVLRRLASLGCADELSAAIAQLERREDPAFRAPDAPYYSMAAQLWLLIALYRISAETPQSLVGAHPILLATASSQDFPHVAIREYAKRTLKQLNSAKVVNLSPSDIAVLDAVNAPAKGTFDGAKSYGRSFNQIEKGTERFKFDGMDTLRYWYEDILRLFPTVAPEEVIKLADIWIIDKWAADPEANWWDKEPRKNRYDERRFGLWSNDHGSFPKIERWGTHLEWNAMHCVVGELLLSHPISDETGYGGLDYWIAHFMPTDPPDWISDHRGPTPLETRLWTPDPRTDNGWVRSVRLDEFKSELFARPPHPGWLAVHACYTSEFPTRVADVNIDTALVSPQTAHALLRALQTASNPYDVWLPHEDEHRVFEEAPFVLRGWLSHASLDQNFDERDPFRYDTGSIRSAPGREFTTSLDLVQAGPTNWSRADGKPVLSYEAWSDEPAPDHEYASHPIRTDGWRLWVDPVGLKEFLTKAKMDLICKVAVNRRLRSEYGHSYEPNAKRKTSYKIYLLRADGTLEDINGRVGSW
jgi:hypothetical protein